MLNYHNILASILCLCSFNALSLEAIKTKETITIDGLAAEASWSLAKWQPIDKLMLGTPPNPHDFSGKFKIMWDENQLYLLAEITDDVLFDQHADPRHLYWDDDCLEIFIDEDASGGNHQFDFNAFAYHVALDNQSVDIGPKKQDGSDNFVLLNDHVTSVWRRDENAPHNIIWELSVRVYDDTFIMPSESMPIENMPTKSISIDRTPSTPIKPVVLSVNKVMGFMLAYCDNDGSATREHFIGSTEIKAINGDKNLGYITADVFDKLILVD